jgi:hypothetical protein
MVAFVNSLCSLPVPMNTLFFLVAVEWTARALHLNRNSTLKKWPDELEIVVPNRYSSLS